MKRRHVPIRTCVGCRQSQPKRDLVRIVRTPAGDVDYDPTGKKSGRGVYICPRRECLDAAAKRGALESQLEVTISEQLLERLRTMFGREEPSDA